MAEIVKQFTKFIFPFKFDQGGICVEQAQMKNKKGESVPLFEPFSQHCESLREGLEGLLSTQSGSAKIADCYRLCMSGRKWFDLPPRKTDMLDFVCRQSGLEPLSVAISEIKLYLFESNVGFVELECEYESRLVEDYFNLNYFICEAKSEKNLFVSHEKVWNEQSKTAEICDKEFSVSALLKKLFTAICKDEKTVTPLYQSSKPLVYSYLLLDKQPENVGEFLQHLAKNYKSSYKFDDSCTKTKTVHPFENSYWTASLNGATNLSFLTQDELTNSFFENDFYIKTKDTYFFLFLNVLHQKYSIMRIMADMGQLDRLSNNFLVMEQELRLARKLEDQAINLKFRAFFKCPSNVEHINQYYDMLYDTLQVGVFYDSFTADIKNLQNICNKYVERIRTREERIKKRKNAKTEIFVSIFGVIVAEISLFNNSWELIEKMLGRTVDFWSAPILIMLGALLTPLITIVLDVKKQIAEIKKLTKLIEVEQDDDLVEDDRARHKNERLAERLRRKEHRRRSKK